MGTKKPYTSEDFFKEFGPLTIADMLRSFRECEEMTQKAFAKKLGISPANLCDLEKGRKLPSPRRAVQIARKLGLPDLLVVAIALEDQLRSYHLPFKVTLAA